jgi:alkyl sulfatase BDS1-like metallo-beta-lactamase superfamily hydrolase
MTVSTRGVSVLTLVLGIGIFSSGAAGQEGVDAAILAEAAKEFQREVIEVTAGVHVAVGFGLANSILIEGSDGVIIVDTMESQKTAREVKTAFDQITTKPVKAIVYTHNHYDHIMGAKVFAGKDEPDVYAHETTVSRIEHSLRDLRGAIAPRSIRQFGVLLPESLRPSAGIGPRLVLDGVLSPALVLPTKTVGSERLKVEAAGVRMELVHAPGETDDQIYIWLPEKKVLLPGDNYYKAFPNLYAIRGTSYRDPRAWAESLDKMMAEGPAYLVPSHTRPVVGEERIRQVLTEYRDGIRSVYEQTITGMNRGLGPDELAATVKLPEHLAKVPALQERYGRVAWSVRSIYAGNLGWFDGNATNLDPLTAAARGERMVRLVGGRDALLSQAKTALGEGDHQWAAELADHLLGVNGEDEAARGVKAAALLAIGLKQTNFNARNYYLTSAIELDPDVAEKAVKD